MCLRNEKEIKMCMTKVSIVCTKEFVLENVGFASLMMAWGQSIANNLCIPHLLCIFVVRSPLTHYHIRKETFTKCTYCSFCIFFWWLLARLRKSMGCNLRAFSWWHLQEKKDWTSWSDFFSTSRLASWPKIKRPMNKR